MWIRIKEMKHADFAAADSARAKWLNENRKATPEVTHKLRIKRRSDKDYDLIVWERREENDTGTSPARSRKSAAQLG